MTDLLSAFQQRALAEVNRALTDAGREPGSYETLGNREKYVVISLAGYRVILYLDGAEILGNGLDLRFENEDFDNLDLLRAKLLAELRPLLPKS